MKQRVYQLSRLHDEFDGARAMKDWRQEIILRPRQDNEYMVTDEVASLKVNKIVALLSIVLAVAVFFGLYWLVGFWAWYL